MNKKNCFTLLIMLNSLSAWSQNSTTLSGKITDPKSIGVSKATVYLLNTNFGTATDEQGDFSISNIPPGNYIVQISALNYATVTKNISLSSDKPKSLNIQLNNSSRQLDEVIVTAQKQEEAVQNIPMSITALSSRQVQEYRLWDTKELSAVVPNLYAGNPGDDRNVISIRGITTTSYDPAVATYIDGVNQFGLDTYISQLFDVERIEVLKGPQGTLYGRNAMGGVVNIITKQPTNAMHGFAEASIGDFKQQRFSAGIQAPLIKNKLFIGIAGMYDSRDGFYTNEFTNSTFDDKHSITGNYYLKYIPGSKWAITLNVKHRNLRNNGAFPLVIPVSPDSALEDPFVLSQNAITEMVDNIYNGSLSLNHFGTGFNFTSQSSYQSNLHYYTNPIDGDFSPYDIVSIKNDYKGWNKVEVLTQEFKFSSPATAKDSIKWTAGSYLFYQNNPVKQATLFGDDAAFFGAPPNSSSITTTTGKNFGAALYGQITYALTNRLNVIAGLRYDYEKKKYTVLGEFQMDPDPVPFVVVPDTSASVDFSAISQRLGLSYNVMPACNLFVTYSRGYRTGGLTQLSSDPSQPPLYSYKPEYSNNFEIGNKNTCFDNRLRVNIAAFITYVNNAQVPTFVIPDAITLTRNTGKLRSTGIEAEVAAAPFKGLEIDYNLGTVNAEYTRLQLSQNPSAVNLTGKKQIFTPDITSSLALQYSYDIGTKQQLKIVVRGEWMHFGKEYFNLANEISQKPYNLLNTRCGIAAKNFELMFWGRNLQDTKYISYAYDFGAVHLGNPKTAGVTLTGKF
jgi:iron complex outermembrane receptor protein